VYNHRIHPFVGMAGRNPLEEWAPLDGRGEPLLRVDLAVMGEQRRCFLRDSSPGKGEIPPARPPRLFLHLCFGLKKIFYGFQQIRRKNNDSAAFGLTKFSQTLDILNSQKVGNRVAAGLP